MWIKTAKGALINAEWLTSITLTMHGEIQGFSPDSAPVTLWEPPNEVGKSSDRAMKKIEDGLEKRIAVLQL